MFFYELYSHSWLTFLSGHNIFLIFNSIPQNKKSSLLLHELAIFSLVCIDFHYVMYISCFHLFLSM